MTMNRRLVLKGLGGALLGLPWLESVRPRAAWAQASSAPPFAIFFRQANGVAAEQSTNEVGQEPERFWPTAPGPLSPSTLGERALAELVTYADRLLVVGNVNMANFNYGDGHARGALQVLTARGPVEEGQGGELYAAAEIQGWPADWRYGARLSHVAQHDGLARSLANGGQLSERLGARSSRAKARRHLQRHRRHSPARSGDL